MADSVGAAQATPTPEQAAAASSIGAVARGSKVRKQQKQQQQLKQRSESATMINRHAKGRLARRRQVPGGKDGNADVAAAALEPGDVPNENTSPSSGHTDAATLAAQQKRQAAGTIGRVAKGRAARKEAKALLKLRDAEKAISATEASALAVTHGPVASPDQADAPTAHPGHATATERPILPPQAKSAPQLPIKLAKPPVTFRFAGFTSSSIVERSRLSLYWQTYTIKVEGFHSTLQTKLVLSIEVRRRSSSHGRRAAVRTRWCLGRARSIFVH
jgi:hypothetical protein